MRLSKRTRQLLTLLLLAISLWLFFRESTKEPLTQPARSETTERPSAFTNGATILNYEDGSEAPVYRVTSVESLYFTRQGKLESITPEITLRDDNGNAYRLRAVKGTFLEQNRQLLLDGKVRVVHFPKDKRMEDASATQDRSEDSPAVFELQTEQLRVDIDKRFIYTEQAVKITYNDHTITAVGLNASLETKTLQLLNQVRGRYELP